MTTSLRAWGMAAGILLVGGCVAHPPRGQPEPAVMPARVAFEIFDGSSGERRSWDDLVQAAASADAVLLGETHDVNAAQAVHGRLMQDVVERAPRAAAALEFYERDHQADVDDDLSDLITRDVLVARVFADPRSDLPGHRALIEAAKAAGRPVIAANAPRRYATLARREGYERLEGLTAAQRQLFAVPTGGEQGLPGGRYRQEFFELMRAAPETKPESGPAAVDPEEEARIGRMFRAQSLWDATMADSVARAVRDGHRPVVLVVGRFHTDFEGGIPQALRSIQPGVRIVTLTSIPSDATSLRSEDRGRADFVVYARAQER